MNLHDILGIASLVCWIIAVIAMLYYHSKGDVIGMIAKFIALAEETGQPGPDKMAMVVDWMYTSLPTPFRAILNKEKLQVIAQFVFDWTRRYALEYLESKKPKKEENDDENLFPEETGVVPEICDECVDDACPIFPEDNN